MHFKSHPSNIETSESSSNLLPSRAGNGRVLFHAENLHEMLFKITKSLGQDLPHGQHTDTYFNAENQVIGFEGA